MKGWGTALPQFDSVVKDEGQRLSLVFKNLAFPSQQLKQTKHA